jgi:hypothetical protein
LYAQEKVEAWAEPANGPQQNQNGNPEWMLCSRAEKIQLELSAQLTRKTEPKGINSAASTRKNPHRTTTGKRKETKIGKEMANALEHGGRQANQRAEALDQQKIYSGNAVPGRPRR